jgi:hypothetical protein
MPVLSRCPLCRAVMRDSRGESRCPKCGELVLPAIRKLCAICSCDVTREKRVRDDAGEYFCHTCWEARLAERGEEPGYVCFTCRQVFASDQVYQDGDELICHACHAQRTLDPNELLAAAADAGDDAPAVFTPVTPYNPPRQVPWGLVSLAGVLLVALIVLIVVLATRP